MECTSTEPVSGSKAFFDKLAVLTSAHLGDPVFSWGFSKVRQTQKFYVFRGFCCSFAVFYYCTVFLFCSACSITFVPFGMAHFLLMAVENLLWGVYWWTISNGWQTSLARRVVDRLTRSRRCVAGSRFWNSSGSRHADKQIRVGLCCGDIANSKYQKHSSTMPWLINYCKFSWKIPAMPNTSPNLLRWLGCENSPFHTPFHSSAVTWPQLCAKELFRENHQSNFHNHVVTNSKKFIRVQKVKNIFQIAAVQKILTW